MINQPLLKQEHKHNDSAPSTNVASTPSMNLASEVHLKLNFDHEVELTTCNNNVCNTVKLTDVVDVTENSQQKKTNLNEVYEEDKKKPFSVNPVTSKCEPMSTSFYVSSKNAFPDLDKPLEPYKVIIYSINGVPMEVDMPESDLDDYDDMEYPSDSDYDFYEEHVSYLKQSTRTNNLERCTWNEVIDICSDEEK